MANLYTVLGVNQECTMEEIQESFKKKRLMYDPDITGDNSTNQIFEELNLAYDTLINKDAR